MTPPKSGSIAVLVLAAILCAAVYAARNIFPPLRVMRTPKLVVLRDEQARLALYSDRAATAEDAKWAALRRELWTAESFDLWRKENVPAGWTVQELGATDAKHLHGRRYAFQRPGATDQEWPQILALLGNLEQARAVSVQSAALAVPPGYAASRRFSQCLLLAVFYFRGDDEMNLSEPKTKSHEN